MCWKSYWDTPRFRLSGHAPEVRRLFESCILPTLGDKPMAEIGPKMLREWHRTFSNRPYRGNRALEALSRLFTFAQEEELLPPHHNPCRLVHGHPERRRERFATEEELAVLGGLLESHRATNPRGVAFLYLLLFTGARPRAIERAKRSDITITTVDGNEFGLLRYDGKSGRETLTLPPMVLEILKVLPDAKDGTLLGIKMPRRLWEEIRQEAGCPDLWARDCRRTFATIGLSSGEEFGIISELLNHRSPATTKVYAKLVDVERARVAGRTAARVRDLLKGKKRG